MTGQFVYNMTVDSWEMSQTDNFLKEKLMTLNQQANFR